MSKFRQFILNLLNVLLGIVFRHSPYESFHLFEGRPVNWLYSKLLDRFDVVHKRSFVLFVVKLHRKRIRLILLNVTMKVNWHVILFSFDQELYRFLVYCFRCFWGFLRITGWHKQFRKLTLFGEILTLWVLISCGFYIRSATLFFLKHSRSYCKSIH